MAGPELEEAVAWIEVSLKGRMVDAGERLLKKERNVFRGNEIRRRRWKAVLIRT
jgi:hypothetical protein